MADQTVRCPKCWLDDRVRKVASVYASGPAAGPTGLKGAGQSPLSQKLEPPPRPKRPSAPGVLVALAVAALLIGGVSLTFGLWDKSSEAGMPGYGAVVAAGRALTIAGVFVLAVGAFVVVLVILAYRRDRRRFTRQLRQWERKMGIWNRLCYCSRDNGVFLPGERDILPPEMLRVFLSGSAARQR